MGGSMTKGAWLASVWVLLLTSAASAQTCGTASLLDLCDLAGRTLSAEERRALADGHEAVTSMLDIKQAAAELGLSLSGVATTLVQRP